MNSDSEKQACTRRCWWMGAGAGLILAFLLLAFGDWRFFGAVFIGIIVAGVVGFLLNMFLCADADTQDTASAPRSQAAGAADASTSMAAGAGAAVAAPGRPAAKPANVGTTTPTEFVSETPEEGDVAQDAAKTGTPKPAVPASTAPKTTASKETAPKTAAKTTASKTTAPKAAAKPKPKAAPKKTAAKPAGAATAASVSDRDAAPAPKPKASTAKAAGPKPKTAAAPKAAPKAPTPTTAKAPKQPSAPAEAAPDVLGAPRAGGADDFKLIDGVGPKLEQTLNELGFYHFDQMANWGKDEIAWVDARLRFKGRIERDGWVAQAKTLAQKT